MAILVVLWLTVASFPSRSLCSCDLLPGVNASVSTFLSFYKDTILIPYDLILP